MSDIYNERRKMPIVAFDLLPANAESIILASGNLDYFVKYGIPFAKSKLSNKSKTPIIFNCVNFKISTGKKLLKEFIPSIPDNNIFFCKTKTGFVDPYTLTAYYKTIRFFVANAIRSRIKSDLFITDIDSLVVNSNLDLVLNRIHKSNITFGIGATFDFINKNLYESSKFNYSWRTVKAGLSYFKGNENGNYALSRVVQSLFNFRDPIPPIDELKLYKAYYGDQLALLLTALELAAAPASEGHFVKCLGCNKGDIVSFGDKNLNSPLWIPPASKRNDKEFEI